MELLQDKNETVKDEDHKKNDFIQSIGEIFNSKVFSDFTFISSDEKPFPVHRCILLARSKVLDKMLNAELLESETKEVTIKDINGETMFELLRFIYTGKANNLKSVAFDLLYAAEKYDLIELKSICAKSLAENLSVENVFQVIILSDRCKAESLMKECIQLIKL